MLLREYDIYLSRDYVYAIIKKYQEVGIIIPVKAEKTSFVQDKTQILTELKLLKKKNYASKNPAYNFNFNYSPFRVALDLTQRSNLKCSHCRTKSDDKNNWQIFIVTNGILLKPKITAKLAELKIDNVQVSLDGSEEIHNKIRGMPNAYRLTIYGLELLKEHKVNFSVRTTLSRINMGEIPYLLKISERLGCKHTISLALPSGKAKSFDKNIFISAKEQRTIYEKFQAIKNELPHVEFRIPFFEILEGKPRRCLAGKSYFAIKSNGDIVGCKLLPEYIEGNVKRESVKEVWLNRNSFSRFRQFLIKDERCSVCKYFKMCNGGCRVTAQNLCGDFSARDPWCPL